MAWSLVRRQRRLVCGLFIFLAGFSVPLFIFVHFFQHGPDERNMELDAGSLAVLQQAPQEIPIVQGNTLLATDPDEQMKSRRDFVVKMMRGAWDSYHEYAWGQNELRPVSKKGHSGSVFGADKMGATIVDALDTLYIMGLDDAVAQGREWIDKNLEFDNIHSQVSVFETNIRFVGGLLSMYALTGDEMYKHKAYSLGKKLLPAFDTPTGIPNALLTLNGGPGRNYLWASGGSSILSEFGTLHLEFTYLSDITGDPVFTKKVERIRDTLKNAVKLNGLYSNYMSPTSGQFTGDHVSMGALGDSFYEYLLKSYIQSGDTVAREMYDAAIDAFEDNGLVKRSSKSGMVYFADKQGSSVGQTMGHLACFVGGLLALGASTDLKQDARTTRHLDLAREVGHTCHESYVSTATGLGPESFGFTEDADVIAAGSRYYMLRPEVIETYFVLWRITGDRKYRDWGWDAAQAIEKYCKDPDSGGYSGLTDVYSQTPQKDDVQQSFFLAETLKYLYLLFSPLQLIDLSQWVLNTEAHPLPVKGKNPFYRPFSPEKP